MGPPTEGPTVSENPRRARAEDYLQIVGRLTGRPSFGRGRPVATRFVDAMVIYDCETSCLLPVRVDLRQRDRSSAERDAYAVSGNIARRVSNADGHPVGYRPFSGTREGGALEDL